MKKLLLSIIIFMCSFLAVGAQVQEYDLTDAIVKTNVKTRISELCLDGSNVWLLPGLVNLNHQKTQGVGILKWDGSKVTRYYTGNGKLSNDTVFKVLRWDNMIIALTADGIKKLQDTTFVPYAPVSGVPNSNIQVHDILKHGDLVVIATDKGMYVANKGTVKHFTETSGLNSDYCVHLRAIGRKLYVSTVRSVYEFDTGTTKLLWVYHSQGAMEGKRMHMEVYKDMLLISDVYSNDSFAMKTMCLSNGKLISLYTALTACGIPYTRGNIVRFFGGGNKVIASSKSISSGILFMDENGVRSYDVTLGTQGLECYAASETEYVMGYGDIVNGRFYLRRGAHKDFEESLMGNFKPVKSLKANNFGFAVGSSNFNSLPGYKATAIAGRDCKSTIFARSLWVGAINTKDSNLHMAATTYAQAGNDFLPGPLTLSGEKVAEWSEKYDRVWEVRAQDIESHIAEAKKYGKVNNVHQSIKEWPVYEIDGTDTIPLAAYKDANANGFYDPQNGDYPQIKGDAAMFFVFHDNTSHYETKGWPLKVQVKGMVWAVHCPAWSGTDTFTIYDNSVFAEYELTNRSSADFGKAYIGQWNDLDLGNYADDYVGCLPNYNVAFGYNGDNNDEGEFLGFGANPPVQNMLYLEGPIADSDGLDNDNDGTIDNSGEQCLMGSFMTYSNDGDSVRGNPNKPNGYYNLMQGKWLNGSPVMRDTNQVRFMFSHGEDPDHPGLYWSEKTSSLTPRDNRFLSSTGPFDWKAGQSVRQVLAYHFMEGTYQSDPASQVKRATEILRKVYNREGWKDCQVAWAGVEDVKPNTGIRVYPVPTGDALHIHLGEFSGKAQLKVYDVQGREQLRFENLLFQAGLTDLDISALSTGIYFIKLECNNTAYSARILKQ